MSQILVDQSIIEAKSSHYTKANFAALSKSDAKVDAVSVQSFNDVEIVPPPEVIEPEVRKVPVDSKTTDSVDTIGKKSLASIATSDVTAFKSYTKDELEKMDIQQLLMTLLQVCYLVQHKTKHLSSDLIATLQMTLDVVVKKLSEQQSTTNWAFPEFLSIGVSGVAAMFGDYKNVAEAVGGATKVLANIVQQTDRAKETPIGAEQSQLHSTLQSYRERIPTANNEEEKTLSSLERSLNAIYELCMKMF